MSTHQIRVDEVFEGVPKETTYGRLDQEIIVYTSGQWPALLQVSKNCPGEFRFVNLHLDANHRAHLCQDLGQQRIRT